MMTKLISELSVSGLPVWLTAAILLIVALAVLIRAIASAKAEVVRAQGESDRTVAVYESGLRHKRWKRLRRDRRRGG